ncbi:hypothetical protein F2Q70_00020320 [Brassica cretica]|uniref:Uncharacterized protein n=1 Tax=Brassica cretica TaxID=69181 RepID=A0A8S9GK72_BRACR|nr:hypothetical protein F2Q70_00020320 [Brassica cretica]
MGGLSIGCPQTPPETQDRRSFFDKHSIFFDCLIDLRMENEEDVLNLNEDADYMSGDELMDENEDDDEAVAVVDTLMSTAETRRKRGGKRRHSRCWKHFVII